jgi:hypothetical protein
MSQAYREGWDRTFGPKPAPQLYTNQFRLRRDCQIPVTLPVDFNLHDLRRLVRNLATCCDDWEPDMGFPSVVFSQRDALVEANLFGASWEAVAGVRKER